MNLEYWYKSIYRDLTGISRVFITLSGMDYKSKHHQVGPGDRTLTVPRHDGDNVLPNLPIFDRLLRFAHRQPLRAAIRDLNAGVEKTYLQLITDALALRRALMESLSPTIQRQLDEDQEVFIALIAPGGYEYAVAFIAILALGAAVVPISEFPSQIHTLYTNKSQQRPSQSRKPNPSFSEHNAPQ